MAPAVDLIPAAEERARHPKAERRQLAKAELLLQLACKAEEWSRMLAGTEAGCLPPTEWRRPGAACDDPLLSIAATYRLTHGDLAGALSQLGDELEARAERAGYDRAWDWIDRDGKPWVSCAAAGEVRS